MPWDLLKVRRKLEVSEQDDGWAFRVGSHVSDFTYEGNVADQRPVIVPPTWEKQRRRDALANVWRRAAEELHNARSIIVIGYSLPESDAFFRLLYALGSVGPSVLDMFWVFDPDEGNVKGKFEDLLGKGATPVFDFFPMTFADAIVKLQLKLL